MDLHCYFVTYDISSPRRWRKVFKVMNAFGEHIQLSVFRCDLTPTRLVELRSSLERLIHNGEDQVLLIKVGKSHPRVLRDITVVGRPREFDLPSPTIV